MSFKSALTVASLAFVATATYAQDVGLMLDVKLSRGTEELGSPSMLTKFGKASSIEVSKVFRIAIEGTDQGSSTKLKLQLFTHNGKEFVLASEPMLVVRYDEPATISFAGEDGVSYTISLRPSRRSLAQSRT